MYVNRTVCPIGLNGLRGVPMRPAGCKCGGSCAGCGSHAGLSGLTMDGSGLFGTGIFGTGVTITDISTWTWAEFAAAGIGLWFAGSLFSSFSRQASGVRRSVSGVSRYREEAKRKRAKRKKLQSEIAAL